MRLRNRLYIVLLSISLTPLLLCGFILMTQNNKNIETIVEENLLGISDSQIDGIGNFFETIKRDMEIVSSYRFLKEAVLASLDLAEPIDEATRNHLEEILEERMKRQSYIQSMVIVDKNYRTVVASETYTAGAYSGLESATEKYLNGEFSIGNAYERDSDKGKVRAVMAYIGIYHNEELIGFLAEEIRTEFFSRYHEGNVFWDDGVLIIRDGNQNIITCGGEGENAADFIELQEKHDQKIETERIKRGYSTEGVVKYQFMDNNYVAQYSDLKYTDWTIRISANIDSRMETYISYVTLFIAIMAVGLFLLVIMNRYVVVRTVRPVEEIKDLLHLVQKTNDYSLRLSPKTDDEMGELQHEVNRLLQQVMEFQMKEKAEQKSLVQKAEKDPMTGIMNKKAIATRVQMMLDENESIGGKIAVGFVDIDDFRDYNTKYGHAEGDHVIKFVAHTLREMIPGAVGRNGGDEFVFCMETDGREVVEQAMKLFKRKLETGVINGVTGERMSIPCSIGVVIAQAGKTDCRKLIQDADEAMYQAKNNGKNTYYIQVK